MRYLLAMIFSIFVFSCSAIVYAADYKTFIHEVDQPFSGNQCPDDARASAMAKAKMDVIEKAGTYIESITVVENQVLTTDEVTAMAGGLLKTEILSKKNYATEDGFGIILVARVDLDTELIKRRMEKILNDRTMLEKYNEIQQREKELLARIKTLEAQNIALQEETEEDNVEIKEKLAQKLEHTIKALPAAEWNRKAIELWNKGKFTDPRKALEYLNQSIKIDPENPKSYNNRGTAYFMLGLYREAVSDYSRAIQLDPSYSAAFNNRGITLYNQQNFAAALDDFNQLIELQPEMAEAYLNRGAVYKNLFQYRSALDDFRMVYNLTSGNLKGHETSESILMDMAELENLCEKARQACNLGLCRALDSLKKQQFCESVVVPE